MSDANPNRMLPEPIQFLIVRPRLVVVVLIVLIMGAAGLHFGRSHDRASSRRKLSDTGRGDRRTHVEDSSVIIDERTAIPIILRPTAEMFPDLWRLPPHNAMATASSPKAINRAVIAVKSAMIKYPSKVLVENLGQIYIVGSLEFDGISAAGTNSTEEVYIAARDLTEGFTDEYLESTFHHEFSSILLRNFPDFFRRPEWINTNPMGFRYGESGVDSIKQERASQDFDRDQHVDGFLNEYARGDIEDDFNSFAESLFMKAPGFWDVVDRYKNVNKKAQLTIQFYQRLHPSFTESWFRDLR